MYQINDIQVFPRLQYRRAVILVCAKLTSSEKLGATHVGQRSEPEETHWLLLAADV